MVIIFAIMTMAVMIARINVGIATTRLVTHHGARIVAARFNWQCRHGYIVIFVDCDAVVMYHIDSVTVGII